MAEASETKASGTLVRPVRQEDAADWRNLYRGYAAFYKLPMTDAILDETWSWLLDASHPLDALVAVSDGKVVGLAHIRPQPKPLLGKNAGFLDDLFVDPALRGQGVGRLLIEGIAAVARERNWVSVRWITAPDNATARKLYDDVAVATAWVTYELKP